MQSNLTLLILIAYLGVANAQNNHNVLKYNPSSTTEQSRIANDVNYKTNSIIKINLKAENFSIPNDWKLISVVLDQNKQTNSNEYVLFFQDSKSAIHSFGIQNNGLISGNNQIFIPSNE